MDKDNSSHNSVKTESHNSVKRETDNSVATENEIDLTLSLRCGVSKETPSDLSLSLQKPLEINPSLKEIRKLCPNPSLYLSLGSSNHDTNPQNVPADPSNVPAEVDINVPAATPSSLRSGTLLGKRKRETVPSSTRPSKRMRKTVSTQFLWATDQPAIVHTQQYLLENNIRIIVGKVHCKKCNKEFELSLNLEQKLADLRNLIDNEVDNWHNRAPPEWLNPAYPACVHCGTQSSTKPIIGKKKKEINWLFLLLGQMLGCCTLDHLKYFCEHNKIHRTGAKDRLLYLTYINLVKQLLPDFSTD